MIVALFCKFASNTEPLNNPVTTPTLLCYHCGDTCKDEHISHGDKIFCCEGCKLVYELLSENNLCTYYQLDRHPGHKPPSPHNQRFAWLDDETAASRLLTFSERDRASVTFSLPQIHCTSCIWLLENLHTINPGIIHVHTDFLKKEASITFNRNRISVRQVVEILADIGYEPDFRFSDLEKKKPAAVNRALLYKIGVAGFCFGNIMMLSFPEYLTGVSDIEPALRHFFSYLNLVLALPVFFYSAGDYFVNSWKSARRKYFSIDLPIALGLLAMLIRSTYEIVSATGAGYFDSMTGLVFFLLTGRYFQELTYRNLSFERDYTSYFPIATTVKKNGMEISTPISNVGPGDKIVIHSEELIPADAVLLSEEASIDYSFVTGEALPVKKQTGDLIYAGARQKGGVIELLVKKTVQQSYLTQLWNHQSFQKNKHASLSSLSDKISKYFTLVILLIALLTALYWFPKDAHRAVLACTSILIIACPCALAITVPFTFGNIIRLLGRNNFYLKNAAVVETIAGTDTIVFDKTGTVTVQQTEQLRFDGELLSEDQWRMIKSLTAQSMHPLSKKITGWLSGYKPLKVNNFSESPGAGISGEVEGTIVKAGSAHFVAASPRLFHGTIENETRVYVSFDDTFAGSISITGSLRDGLAQQVNLLQKDFQLFLLSGDRDGDRERMESIFPNKDQLHFQQTPAEKLSFIDRLQQQNKKVMMIGDGLNDAGALRQSNVGIAVSDDLIQFSPACDAILKGSEFIKLPAFIQLCKSSVRIIWLTFALSLLYNLVGIAFAVQGELSPMVAAILMPLSSISVILITTVATKWKANRLGL